MAAPWNIPLKNLTAPPRDWQQRAREWSELNRQVGGNPEFHALTVKAAYVVGIIHQHCECVSYLLKAPDLTLANQTHAWLSVRSISRGWQMTYMPAFALFASAIDLLGRCLRGNADAGGNTKDIEAGFKWLRKPWYGPDKAGEFYDPKQPDSAYGFYHVGSEEEIISTSNNRYGYKALTAMRHYAAHGQATSANRFPEYYEVLAQMPAKLAAALDIYWNLLPDHADPCNRLARANLLPFRGLPILTSWVVFEKAALGKYHSITEIFQEFDWRTS